MHPLGLKPLLQAYDRVRGPADGFAERLLRELDIRWVVQDCHIERIPLRGPVVLVANHPFGLLEGAVLCATLLRLRKDFRVLTNHRLSGFPELTEYCIFVDPFEQTASTRRNITALREAHAWLKGGGLLVIFPAGEVSTWDPRAAAVVDRPWLPTAARLAQRTRATVIPVYFAGSNSLPFHLIGLVHPRLRTLALPAELVNKRGREVRVQIGRAIAPDRLARLAPEAAIRYLRWRTYLLGERKRHTAPPALPSLPIAPPAASALDLEKEIRALPDTALVASLRELRVYLGTASAIPKTLREIGRLREFTFRQAGEGTGKAVDIDRFDAHYQHLFLWNDVRKEIAGAYRLAFTSDVATPNLYTSTLFHYQPDFFRKLGPAIELGRSFVRPEYQRQFAPLFLLWKGIGSVLTRRPEVTSLFGAVSISEQYTTRSRRMIAEFFRVRDGKDPLCRFVKPRRPLRTPPWQAWNDRAVAALLQELDDLDGPIADLEGDAREVPILLRQYVRMGAKLLAFNVDPAFSNALDGLAVVDLTETDPALFRRLCA